jgi:hypothetical protein
MSMIARLVAVSGFVLVTTLAAAIETAQWPPPSGVETRMHELQGVLGSRDSTPAQREAAREELSSLLKSPAGQARGRTPDEKPTRPPRASIDPFPSVVKPAYSPPLGPAPPIAHIEVLTPPRPLVIPNSGAVASPSNGFAVDPRTGAVLHEIPGGYVNPRTGQVTPH